MKYPNLCAASVVALCAAASMALAQRGGDASDRQGTASEQRQGAGSQQGGEQKGGRGSSESMGSAKSEGDRQSQRAQDRARPDNAPSGGVQESGKYTERNEGDRRSAEQQREDKGRGRPDTSSEQPSSGQDRQRTETEGRREGAAEREANGRSTDRQTGERRQEREERRVEGRGQERGRGEGRVNITVAPQERTRVREFVDSDREIRRYRRTEIQFEQRVGVVVPERVVFYDPPPRLVELIPDIRPFKIIVVENLILVIDPGTREIVDVIDLGSRTARD